MSDSIKHHLKSRSTWKRGLYMLLFAIFYSIAEIVLFFVVFFQFIHKLVSGEVNDRLRSLGQQLATYIYQITCFLSFNTERLVYPFANWPEDTGPADAAEAAPGDDPDTRRIEDHNSSGS